MKKIEAFSFGLGDRFAHQGKAQLKAIQKICEEGFAVVPVWNKSHREHKTVHSEPSAVRAEADQATQSLGWEGSYYVDADHINLSNVESFLEPSDFFTLDVTSQIGKDPAQEDLERFVRMTDRLAGTLELEGLDRPLEIGSELIRKVGSHFLAGMREAERIYRYIRERRGNEDFVAEVSIDETEAPQSPAELLLILAALADFGVPVQTIAPKFTGRFNKGVDYVGDLAAFEREFREDLAVLEYATGEFGLPENLKLSVHSGSDKFAIYPVIRRALMETGAGLHIKTAGTTWLAELTGLALSGGKGLSIAREVYRAAHARAEELCAPYSTVIDIRPECLPSPAEVDGWSSQDYANALRHDSACPAYNPDFRQLLHVGYKVAAEMGDRFTAALEENEETIGQEVTDNLYDRHLKRLLVG